MIQLEFYILFLEEYIKDLEENDLWSKWKKLQPDDYLDLPKIPKIGIFPNVCQKCGLKLDKVMGYVCSQPQCPTGLGGVWCGNINGN